MSTGFTSYGMATMLRAIFTPDVALPTVNAQLAVCFSAPVNNATGDQLDEPPMPPDDVDVGYSRGSVTMSSEFWAVSDFGEIYNADTIAVGTPTEYWGPLYGWALIDADTNECIVVGELVDPIDPVQGEPLEVPVASLVIGMYG